MAGGGWVDGGGPLRQKLAPANVFFFFLFAARSVSTPPPPALRTFSPASAGTHPTRAKPWIVRHPPGRSMAATDATPSRTRPRPTTPGPPAATPIARPPIGRRRAHSQRANRLAGTANTMAVPTALVVEPPPPLPEDGPDSSSPAACSLPSPPTLPRRCSSMPCSAAPPPPPLCARRETTAWLDSVRVRGLACCWGSSMHTTGCRGRWRPRHYVNMSTT